MVRNTPPILAKLSIYTWILAVSIILASCTEKSNETPISRIDSFNGDTLRLEMVRFLACKLLGNRNANFNENDIQFLILIREGNTDNPVGERGREVWINNFWGMGFNDEFRIGAPPYNHVDFSFVLSSGDTISRARYLADSTLNFFSASDLLYTVPKAKWLTIDGKIYNDYGGGGYYFRKDLIKSLIITRRIQTKPSVVIITPYENCVFEFLLNDIKRENGSYITSGGNLNTPTLSLDEAAQLGNKYLRLMFLNTSNPDFEPYVELAADQIPCLESPE